MSIEIYSLQNAHAFVFCKIFSIGVKFQVAVCAIYFTMSRKQQLSEYEGRYILFYKIADGSEKQDDKSL